MKRIIDDGLQVNLKMCLVVLASLVGLGCVSQLRTLAMQTMDNAQTTIDAASNAGAQQAAPTPLQAAQEMLSGAEAAMQAGDTERAYRLALRAYLQARIARETSLAIQHEAKLQEAQTQLVQSQQRTAALLQELITIKAEYEKLKTLNEENE